MSDRGGQALVPKLRFPEFKHYPPWDESQLGDVATILKGKGLSKGDLQPSGKHPCVRYGELYTHYSEVIREVLSRTNVSANDLLLSQVGDVLVPASGETKIDIATASCVMLEGVALGSDLNVLRSPLHGPFLSYYLNASKRFEIAKVAQGDAVVHLYPSQLEKVKISVPRPDEQKKIADCLISLDDLIAAEGRKLEALRDHKKGLLQQLFPEPGKTRPRLRFPEFHDAGEWEAMPLGPMTVKVGSGITPTGGSKTYKTEGRPFVRSQNVGWGELLLEDVAFIDDETHLTFASTELQLSDVLLNITGASIGRSALVDSRIVGGNVNQHVCVIRTNPAELNPVLLNQYIISEYGQKQVDSFQAGGNRQGLNFVQVRSFLIPCPPTMNEQERIADCLSTLDTIASAQSERIVALQAHKRGLMQQLFPSPDEA